MKPLSLGQPVGTSIEAKLDWVIQALQEIERASQEDSVTIFDSYSITGTLSKTRAINVTSPTAANAAAVISTLIDDFQRRGVNRLEAT